MKILKHRANTIDEINPKFGLEIDIRDFNSNLVLAHDHPTEQSILLSNYLKEIHPEQFLAINIKSSEIEDDLYSILNEFNISNYFTFDWPVPSLLKSLTKNLNSPKEIKFKNQLIGTTTSHCKNIALAIIQINKIKNIKKEKNILIFY